MRTYIRMYVYVQDYVYFGDGNIFSVGGRLCRKQRTNLKEKRSLFLPFPIPQKEEKKEKKHPEWVEIFSLYDISTANQIFFFSLSPSPSAFLSECLSLFSFFFSSSPWSVIIVHKNTSSMSASL